MIVEDNVYADLRYDGERLPSLYSLDDAGLVVKVDSFSKTLMPALRLGWVTGDPAAIDAMARVRRDLGVSQLVARAIARFVGDGRYEPHIASVCELYRTKRDAVAAALEQHCTGTMTWNNPAGGYFFWLELADDVDGKAVQRAAFMEGVLCRPGERFYGEPEHGKQRLRLAFTMAPVADLERAVEILGKVRRYEPALNSTSTGTWSSPWIARHTRWGVNGGSSCCTPNGASASTTAFQTAAADPVVPIHRSPSHRADCAA